MKRNKNTNVTTADVDVKNGVIHVIDKVLLPPSVVDQALANDSFSILVQAVVKAGLVETLSGPISVTLTPSPAINTTSMIVATDVQASNGIIHVINKVLLP